MSDTDKKNNAAAVGNDEVTCDVMPYIWQDNIVLYDFPGLNSIPWEEYIKYVTKQSCDIYIIMHSALYENDIKIAKHISNQLKKQFFFCRSYTDLHVEKFLDDAAETKVEMDEQEAIDKNKSKTLGVFDREKFGSYYDKNFTKELCKLRTYNICCGKKFRKYDWNDLNKSILDNAKKLSPEIAENIAEHSPFLVDKKLLRTKREALQKRIIPLSVTSGVTDFVPVGGSIADIIIIITEVERYRESFGLTEDLFKEAADSLNFDDQLKNRQEIMRIIGIDSFYINMKNLFLTILSGLSIPTGIAITKALIGSVGAGLSMYKKENYNYC